MKFHIKSGPLSVANSVAICKAQLTQKSFSNQAVFWLNFLHKLHSGIFCSHTKFVIVWIPIQLLDCGHKNCNTSVNVTISSASLWTGTHQDGWAFLLQCAVWSYAFLTTSMCGFNDLITKHPILDPIPNLYLVLTTCYQIRENAGATSHKSRNCPKNLLLF